MKLPKAHIRKGFLKKNLVTLIAAAVLLVGTGTAYGTLSTREADRGFDPVSGVNEDRYQVLVSGEGYKLTKQQEKNYKLQKKQNEVNAAQAAQNAMNSPTTIRTSGGSRIYRPSSSYRYRYRGSSSYRTTGTIFIATNIYSQKSAKLNWKSGDEFSFTVTAYTYQNGKKKTISKDNLSVSANKGTLKHTGSKDGNQYYVLKLGEGTNKITVTAKDNKSKKKTKRTFTIDAGKKAATDPTKPTNKPTKPTKPTEPTEPKEETVTVTFTDELFGGILSGDYTIKGEMTAYDFLKKIEDGADFDIKFNSDRSIKWIEGDFGEFTLKPEDREDDKIKEIYRQEAGLEDDAEVPTDDEDYTAWCDDKEKKVNDAHRLGEGYPFSSSKWEYDPDQKVKAPSAEIDLEFKLY